VKVYTAGLSKKSAREYKKDRYKTFNIDTGPKPSPSLQPDDLRWRSILELSDYPEFDLIIDTFGEQLYSTHPEGNFAKISVEIFEAYIRAVIKKLLPGGRAFLCPVYIDTDAWFTPLIKKELGVEINDRWQGIEITKINKNLEK